MTFRVKPEQLRPEDISSLLGLEVEAEAVLNNGAVVPHRGVITAVTPDYVELGSVFIMYGGRREALKGITQEDGKTLFENHSASKHYGNNGTYVPEGLRKEVKNSARFILR